MINVEYILIGGCMVSSYYHKRNVVYHYYLNGRFLVESTIQYLRSDTLLEMTPINLN